MRRVPYGLLSQSEVFNCVPVLTEVTTAEIADRVFHRHRDELGVRGGPDALQPRVRQHLYNLRALGGIQGRQEKGKLLWKRA